VDRLVIRCATIISQLWKYDIYIYVDIIRDEERLRRSDATGVVWDEARTWELASNPSKGALAHVN